MRVWYGVKGEHLVEVEFLGIIDSAGTAMAVIRKAGMDLRAVPISKIHFKGDDGDSV